ncbi:MAG: hypothetical protein Q4A28_10025 [Brachymonas sp.]|nr:hypothetical protein [Brachymonas sp.]
MNNTPSPDKPVDARTERQGQVPLILFAKLPALPGEQQAAQMLICHTSGQRLGLTRRSTHEA